MNLSHHIIKLYSDVDYANAYALQQSLARDAAMVSCQVVPTASRMVISCVRIDNDLGTGRWIESTVHHRSVFDIGTGISYEIPEDRETDEIVARFRTLFPH
jgi:hypothetical protein